MRVLGINAIFHDPAAALVAGGGAVAAVGTAPPLDAVDLLLGGGRRR
ncbi:hypothetical protein [Actinomadura formosensis]|nr:hypothetical protein [Actinomadura formosensis]